MSDRILSHPANRGILAFLKHLTRKWRGPRSCHPSETEDPYYRLGTHPDLVERLWDTLTAGLPADPRWVLYGRPVLVHPLSGVAFAFATGSLTYAMRIPQALRPERLSGKASARYTYRGGETLDLGKYDPDWFFAGPFEDEEQLCLMAYEAAGGGG